MSRPATNRRSIPTILAATVATLLGGAVVSVAVTHRDGAVYPVRARLEQLTAERSVWLGVIAVLAALALHARAHIGVGAATTERVAGAARQLRQIRVGPALALPVIVALSASLWTVLSAETTIPRVLADELIYSGLGKSLAEQGSYLLRGDRDTGHSLLYPLLISPAYGLTRNGVSAHIAVQALNAIVFSLAAVPAYFLARRVVPHGLATLVATLAVFNPWGGFSAWVMTESAFYLVFVTFALALVLALERPTMSRQLVVVGLIVVLAAIRTQAAVIPAAVVVAVLVVGLSQRAVARALREQRLLLTLLAALLAVGALVLLVGSLSAYDVLFDGDVSPVALVRWGAWNAGAFAVSVGIAATLTLPAALAGLLGRGATRGERATGAATVTLTAAMIAAVALLSASEFGLGYLQERSVFYVAPLVFTCFASWLHDGARRRWRLTAITTGVVVGLVAWLPSPPLGGWTAQAGLKDLAWPLGIPAAVVVVVVGALIVLLARSAAGPVVLTVIVLATIAAVDQTSWNSPVAPSESKGLAWIDAALPDGAEATIVHVDTSVAAGDACGAAAKSDQQFFVVLSEFLNTRVNQVTYLYHPVERDFLGARKLELGPSLTLLDRGEPLGARYVVVDSRIPVSGRAIARLDLADIGSDLSNGASLTLWEAAQPVRLDLRGPLRLAPRADGRPCA
jgi:hypothetical protein